MTALWPRESKPAMWQADAKWLYRRLLGYHWLVVCRGSFVDFGRRPQVAT